MDYFIGTVFVFGAYLTGSISFAIVICKLLKLPDPRTQGSGNPGATNVVRKNGKWLGLLTFCGDVSKAVVPMLLVRSLGAAETTVALVGTAAFIGHLYPLYHGFRGGKGVATFLGILAVLQWQAALVWIAVWLTVLAIFRYVSIASILAALVAAAYTWAVMQNQQVVFLISAMTAFILIRHSRNMKLLGKLLGKSPGSDSID